MLLTRILLLNNSPLKRSAFAGGNFARIEKFPEMISSGLYPDPIRFGRPSARVYNPGTGFSDHYPVAMMVAEKTKK